MPYYVYILECNNGCLYTGITNDIKRRMEEHFSKKGCRYTVANPPKKLKYTEKHPSRSSASKREAQIKKLPRKNKLALIKG